MYYSFRGYVHGNTALALTDISEYEGKEVIITILDDEKKESEVKKTYSEADFGEAFGMWDNELHKDSENPVQFVRNLRKGRDFDIR